MKWFPVLILAWILLVGGQDPPTPAPTLAPTPTPTPSPWDNPAFMQCVDDGLLVVKPDDLTHLEMLDYTGKAIDDLGNYDQCLALPANVSQYCFVETQIAIRGSTLFAYVGICAPASCNSDFLHEIIVLGVTHYNLNDTYPIQGELNSLEVYCQPRNEKVHFTNGAIAGIFMASFFGLLVLSGTLIEYFESQIQTKITEETTSLIAEENGHNSTKLSRPTSLQDPLLPPPSPGGGINAHPADGARVVYVPYDKKQPSSKFVELLKCFAIGTNMKFLLNDNRGGEIGLAAMNGLRVLMMAWIILGHTLTDLTTPVGFDNLPKLDQKILESVAFQVIPGAELAVDVFFYISGFLVVYMVLKEMNARKGRQIPWGLFYFHRYWRLTPVYGFVIFFYTTLTPYFVHGPFAHLYREQKTSLCDKYWWTNLLYINNFIPSNSNDQCLGWGWYLADDMQYFIFTPIIILLYKKSKRAAWALLLILTAFSTGLIAVLVAHYHLQPLNPGSAQWMSIAYNKPYTRMAPYLIGIGFAFIVQEDIDLAKNWMVRWAGYIIGGTATTCSVFLTTGFWKAGGWSDLQNVLYASLARVGFALGVAWLMYACYKHHGGPMRIFLGGYIWVPLARLTYTAYLTHPAIMFVINYSSTQVFHYSGVYATTRYTSHLLLSYACALLFHLTIEKPTANLERILLPNKKKH